MFPALLATVLVGVHAEWVGSRINDCNEAECSLYGHVTVSMSKISADHLKAQAAVALDALSQGLCKTLIYAETSESALCKDPPGCVCRVDDAYFNPEGGALSSHVRRLDHGEPGMGDLAEYQLEIYFDVTDLASDMAAQGLEQEIERLRWHSDLTSGLQMACETAGIDVRFQVVPEDKRHQQHQEGEEPEVGALVGAAVGLSAVYYGLKRCSGPTSGGPGAGDDFEDGPVKDFRRGWR